ncbi:MAG: 23S rRNA (pseudouridine(1915)-N(3))-methyltransferase RlmH [Bacilli bacterium]|nr:23S rRNA (pseudouridine(1915)-N(3))-methyltransferase RlmH [Bacilli bacterium]MDD7314148.1 23S rRNA (pseudouridine(1915)-N(3))-methyltransferase RlmH [Bacilli bacterium]MDY4052287.1 23S rRNA (pseudouridine(1915)-N(3))-methyltransferase RlmH [Bacilli bacterium]
MIRIICVGKIKENYISKGIDEYLKRLNGYQKIEIVELKEGNNIDITKTIKTEGEDILSKINSDDFVITLEIEGKMISSVELAEKIQNLLTYGKTKIDFIIGGSWGLSDEVKKRSNYALSFSKFTFPHQLMRLVLIEQIYRAFTIINNKEYHK